MAALIDLHSSAAHEAIGAIRVQRVHSGNASPDILDAKSVFAGRTTAILVVRRPM